MPRSIKKTYLTLLPQMLLAGIISGAFVYFFFQQVPIVILLGFLIGIQVHFYIANYEIFLKPRLTKLNFLLALFTSTLAYVIFIIIAVFIGLIAINSFNVSGVLNDYKEILFSKTMLIGILFGLAMGFLFSSYSMFNTLLGKHFLFKLFTGKYHTPFEEDRVFMFLDLKSSTTLAEQLGHKVFLQLLNDFFYDVSIAVSDTRGEIYKYVGDEAIITWKLSKVANNTYPLDCFFLIKKQVERKRASYLKKYKLIPDFKAGLHGGKVVTGEMGFVKKEIAFLGDVLNTTARIEGICNTLNKNFIVSDYLISKMGSTKKYRLEPLGEKPLKGKQHPVRISAVHQPEIV
jgi:adenylate cyclase